MKFSKKLIIVSIVWVAILLFLYSRGMLSFNVDDVRNYINQNKSYAIIIFLILYVIRIAVFVPSVTLMIIGGLCFGHAHGFWLSMFGVAISQTVLFIIAKLLKGSKFEPYIRNKYPDLSRMIHKSKYKIIFIGVMCPMIPNDIICLLAALTGIDYFRYILTIIVLNIPVVLLYDYADTIINGSFYNIAMIILTIVLVTYFSFKSYNKIKAQKDI